MGARLQYVRDHLEPVKTCGENPHRTSFFAPIFHVETDVTLGDSRSMRSPALMTLSGIALLLIVVVGTRALATSIAELPSPQKKIKFMNDRTVVKAAAALAVVGCRPINIADAPPIGQGDAVTLGHELTISIGSFRFVRTDVGDPDGTLTLVRGGKEICVVETSLLSGIRFVPSKSVLILKFSSGSGHDWQLFQAGDIERGNQCVSLGLVSNKEAVAFESQLPGLPQCR
jgi:hypothetical protein